MAPRGKGTTQEDLLEQYSNLLDQVTAQPYQRQLHLQHIQLTQELQDVQGLEDARNMMATYFPLSEGNPFSVVHNCPASSS